MSRDDYKGVIDAVKDYLDNAKDNDAPVYSSHIPGSDWSGTPYLPIYEACNDWDHARRLFGLLAWEAVIEHEDDWVFINEEKSNDTPGGKIYFLKK